MVSFFERQTKTKKTFYNSLVIFISNFFHNKTKNFNKQETSLGEILQGVSVPYVQVLVVALKWLVSTCTSDASRLSKVLLSSAFC